MIKIDAANTDQTLPILQDLLKAGYDTVTWRTNARADKDCRRLNRRKWTLKGFLRGLSHEAPIFEHSHCNCRCSIVVTKSSVTTPRRSRVVPEEESGFKRPRRTRVRPTSEESELEPVILDWRGTV